MLPASPNRTKLPARLTHVLKALTLVMPIDEHAFLVRVTQQLINEDRNESECLIALLSLSMNVLTDEIEALATPDEVAQATKLALTLFDPTELTRPSASHLYALLTIADLRLLELIDHAERHGGPEDGWLEAPHEVVDPFYAIIRQAPNHPLASRLMRHLIEWIRIIQYEPSWALQERPAFWLIAPTGNKDLRTLHDVLRNAGFLIGKTTRHKGPATIDRIESHDVLVVSSTMAQERVFRRLMTSIAAHYPFIYVREMDQSREGRSFLWEKMPQSLFQKGLIFKRMEVFATSDIDPLPVFLEAFGDKPNDAHA